MIGPASVAARVEGSAVAGPAPKTFLDEVIAAAGGDTRLGMCIQCGTCSGSCPSAADMEHTPRRLFALIRAGMRDSVLHSNTPWMCVTCNLCVVRCPQEVRIPDVMAAVKSIAEREGVAASTASSFSRTFVSNIHRYGRSYEIGLVAKHYLRHYPLRLPGMAGAGLGMLASGRMGFKVHRIRNVRQLRSILDRAGDLERLQ